MSEEYPQTGPAALGVFSIKRLFTPFSMENRCWNYYDVRENRVKFGYTLVYMFGVRVATIHRTKPWN